MKVTVDVDCTPEEARRFMGLPDLTAVHEAYTDKMKSVINDGVTPDMLEPMMRNWMPMGEAGMNVWRNMFEQIAGSTGTK